MINQLKANIKTIAESEGKLELEIINDLLTGASLAGHEEIIEVLLKIRQPFIQSALDEIYNRVAILLDGKDVTDIPYFENFLWGNLEAGDIVWLEDCEDLIPVSAVFTGFENGIIRLVTDDSSY